MTAFTVASIIAITIIGLVLVAELVAVTMLLLRAKNLVQDVRGRIDPVVNESTHLLHTANDVANTVKVNSQRIAGTVSETTDKVATTVAGVTDKITERVDRTTAQMRATSSDTIRRITPPLATIVALFAGFRAIAMLQRLISVPVVTALALIVGTPFGLRTWRSIQQERARRAAAVAAEREPLLLRPRVTPEEVYRAA